MIGTGFAAMRAQQQAASAYAELNHHAAMDARAYQLLQKYGDKYAGMTLRGEPILWRETTIPAVKRMAAIARGER